MKSWTTRVAVLVVLVMSVACGQSHSSSDAWSHSQSRGFSFDHPQEWKERPQRFIHGNFSSTFLLLSTRKPDADLCYRRTVSTGGFQEGCDLTRLGKLAAGDVFLIAIVWGMPTDSGLPAGESLVVDGHDARLTRDNRFCAAVGADDAVTLTISQAPSHDYLILEACALQVPGLDQTMRRVAASARLAPPS
jgi:hypothetical protein